MNVYYFDYLDNEGNLIKLSDFKNKNLLIVNVASKCGYTKQYEGLQKLYEEFKDKDLEIIAFPCNQFGQQEPEDNDSISKFCKINYGVTFKIASKIEVNGENETALYRFLKESAKNLKDIDWNFEKFLIKKNSHIDNDITHYESSFEPEFFKEILQEIE